MRKTYYLRHKTFYLRHFNTGDGNPLAKAMEGAAHLHHRLRQVETTSRRMNIFTAAALAAKDGDNQDIYSVIGYRGSNYAIGAVTLTEFQNRHAELGFFIAEKYRGEGMASAAVCEVVQKAVRENGLQTIWAFTPEKDFNETNILHRLGARPVNFTQDFNDGHGPSIKVQVSPQALHAALAKLNGPK